MISFQVYLLHCCFILSLYFYNNVLHLTGIWLDYLSFSDMCFCNQVWGYDMPQICLFRYSYLLVLWLAYSVWTKSLVCKDAVLQGIPLFRSVSEDFAVRKVSSLPAIRTTCHPVRTLICPLFHLSGQHVIPSGRPDRPSIIRPNDVAFRPNSPLYREASVPACICSDVSATLPDASQYSTKLQILSKFSYGKIATTVRTTWIHVRTRFSLR